MTIERIVARPFSGLRLRGFVLAACLLLGGASSAGDGGSGPEGADKPPPGVVLSVLPDDEGRTILDTIGEARTSIDISIYTIGDERILEALKEAKARGVTIRILVNGQGWIHPATFPGSSKYDAVYALMCGYSPLAEPYAGRFTEICPEAMPAFPGLLQAPGSGRVMFHASSNNVALTHQKTILIDAADSSGRGRWPHELPPSAAALILTGNLSGYPWPDCASGESWDPASCPFYSARDFGLTVRDPAIIAEVERVFNADWYCHSPCEDEGLLEEPPDPGLQLVWSNGITGIPDTYALCENGCCEPAALYPSASAEGRCDPYATGEYPYPLTGPDGSSGGTIQGNARRELLYLIQRAKKTLDVYNEELADEQIVVALVGAAASGVRVRIVMTEGNPHTYWSEERQRVVDAFDELTEASAAVKLFPNDASSLYIHAKVLLADVIRKGGRYRVPVRAAMYMGSQNISTASLNQNRELGVILDGKPNKEILKAMAAVFEADFGAAPILWTPGRAPIHLSDGISPPAPTESGRYVPLACGPEGLPYPRPEGSGFGPWNPGYGE